LRKTKAEFDRKREERIQTQRKELRDCEAEINRLNMQQPELEQRMSDLMLNEKTYKDTIIRLRSEREAVGASRAQLEAESREQGRAQEVRLERRLEDLERENQELQEKMTALENNVVFFIKEMSGLIDFQENIRVDKDSPVHRGSRPTDKKPDRSKQYAGARNLNLEF
jgi:chromosome segregation ATPase